MVLDWSKNCDRLLSVDLQRRTCVVEPGNVLDDLNRQLAVHGLRFGPEPATHMNCTIGGMIGNNSRGATAQRTGKVVDNIVSLDVLTYDGARFTCGRTSDEEYQKIERRGDRRADVYRSLRRIRDTYAETIRATYPDIPRRVSGYNLGSLLPAHGFDVAGALVGSDSTLATVLRAELTLVPVLPARTLVVLGYPDIMRAADAVPSILPYEPVALEGVDRYLIRDEKIKRLNTKALEQLPEGTGYLMVQFAGESTDETYAAAQRMLDALAESPHEANVAFLDEPADEDELWRVREAGLGATANVPNRADTFEGWEDSAVRSSGWVTTCATCTRSSVARATPARACMGTSVMAACTPGSRSTSTPPTVSRPTGGSWNGPPVSSRPTAARSLVSTATDRVVASCCRGCSATMSFARSRR